MGERNVIFRRKIPACGPAGREKSKSSMPPLDIRLRFGARNGRRRRGGRAAGFSLVELLIVVAILALLVSLTAPALRRATDLARQSWCHANNHQMMNAVNVYCSAHRDALPFGERTWPWMGMLDIYEEFLFDYAGSTKNLH